DGKPMPEGKSQVNYATRVVKERFAQASVLFAIDQLVKGVIGAITGLVRGILSFLPIPGMQQIASILHAFLRVAVGFIDEVILALQSGPGRPTLGALHGKHWFCMAKTIRSCLKTPLGWR
ncbi:hypothetical protein ACFOLL_09740, partial [Falsochrobactrum ovis]